MDMVAQHRLQRLLQQMGRGVGTHDSLAALHVNGCHHNIVHLDGAGDHLAVMQVLAALVLLDVGHHEAAVAHEDHALVGDLAAHFGVEGGLVQNNDALFAAGNGTGDLIAHAHSQNLGVAVILGVADKGGGGVVQPQVDACPGQIAQRLPGFPGANLLLLHQLGKCRLIQGHILVGHHFQRQVNGEAVGIVQLEGVGAGELRLSLGLMLCQHVGEDRHAAVDGAGKVLFLHLHHLGDIVAALPQIGVVNLVFLHHGLHNLIEEGVVDAQKLAVAGCPPQQTAQDVAAAFVAGKHAVGDHKGGCADMVGDDSQGNVHLHTLAIGRAGQLRDLVGDVHDGIHIEQGVHVLADHRQALQTHAGVDVLLRQLRVVAVAVVVELGEDVVPDLHVPVTVAAHGAAGLAAAVLFAPVVVNFGAGTAGAGAMLPEVVLLAEFEDTVFGNANILVPDAESLFINRCCLITCKYRGIQAIGIQSHPLGRGQKFPSPPNGLFLKVISKGEVAQHLKIGAVAGRVADVFNIAGADALLAGSDPVPGRLLLAGEIGLHRRHTGVDEQQAGITLGNQGKAGQAQMALGLEKVQEHLPQFVEAIVLGFRHIHFLHFYVNFLIFDCKPDFRPEWNRWQRSTAAFLPKNKMLRPGHRGEALLHGTTLIIPHPWGHLSHR